MNNPAKDNSIVVAISGASGSCYASRLLEILLEKKMDIHLIISESAKQIAKDELDEKRFLFLTEKADVKRYHPDKFNVSIASGSVNTRGMVVIPASMGTIGRIASGTSDNLIIRVADVHLKEKRKLIVVPREAPLNRIHIENLLRLHDAGAIILPAMPSFYMKPETINDLIDTVVARVLDHLNISNDLNTEYKP